MIWARCDSCGEVENCRLYDSFAICHPCYDEIKEEEEQ